MTTAEPITPSTLAQAPVPKADRIRQALQRWIQQQQLKAGDRLPSERKLAENFSVNTRTIRRSLEQLAQQGLIATRPRVGYFVKQTADQNPGVVRLAVVLPDFMKDMTRMHSTIRLDQDNGEPLPGDATGVHPFTGNVMAGVADAIDPTQYACNTIFFAHDQLCTDLLPILQAGGISGMLLRPMMEVQRQTIEQLLDAQVKIVLLNPKPQHLERLNLTSIHVDQAGPLHEAMQHLMDLGHQRVVLLRFDRSLHDPMLNQAVQMWLPRLAPQWRPRFEVRARNQPHDTDLRVAGEMFNLHPRPTAVITQDEFLAWEVLRQCRLKQIAVPKDLSVVSLGNNAATAFPTPISSPASGRLNTQAVAMAMRQLVQLVQGQTSVGQQIILEAPIQWTCSVAAPPPNGHT